MEQVAALIVGAVAPFLIALIRRVSAASSSAAFILTLVVCAILGAIVAGVSRATDGKTWAEIIVIVYTASNVVYNLLKPQLSVVARASPA